MKFSSLLVVLTLAGCGTVPAPGVSLAPSTVSIPELDVPSYAPMSEAPPTLDPAGKPLSSEGGICGGFAGFQCMEGLRCTAVGTATGACVRDGA